VGILPRRHQYWLLILVLIASTLLIFVPAPLNAVIPAMPNQLYQWLFLLDGGMVRSTPFNPLDVLAKIGLWLNVGLTAILVTFFLAKLHQRLQQQQQALQQAQLEGQSQQHLLNMSLAAASTAHELSTPLATISLLAAEAADAYRYQEPENAQAALAQIQQLVSNCKTQISASLKQHHLERSEQLSLLAWPDYLENLLTQWKTLRPQVKVVLSIKGNAQRVPQTINLPILSQSITSLFNNACEASPEPLQLHFNWDEQQVRLCLYNQGQGFSEALLAQFPQPQLSDKTDGHGVGLALAHANIQQLGGQLMLSNPPEGGALACISLPIAIENWQLRQNVATSQASSLS
jgi:two-component system sensor histidine kinase RegB